MNVARSRDERVLDDPVGQVDDRPGLLAGEILVLDVLGDAELEADLFDHVGELHVDLLGLAELLPDLPLATEQADDLLAGHLVDLGRDRDFEGI